MVDTIVSPDFDAFIFDMDGTLLDTLPDLIIVTNEALKHFGYPERTGEEILAMVGKGARYLISQALPRDESDKTIDAVHAYWQSIYPTFGHKMTVPYPGIIDTLTALRNAGKKTAVLSNKYDEGVKDLAQRFFPGLFDLVLGEGPVPRKPDPSGIIYIMNELDVEPECCAYFGDSASDIQAAHGANTFAVGVTWGYQSREALASAKANLLLDDTTEITKITR